MIAPMDLQARVQQYLTERRRLGFHLRSPGHALPNFARFVEASKHTGALTVELMAQWARQVSVSLQSVTFDLSIGTTAPFIVSPAFGLARVRPGLHRCLALPGA